jgi:CubicO group peptidase (beta-lactamase class C family)
MDAWVERTMKTFDVPGIAVAIVKDGKPVLMKGYGVRTLGSADKVDEHTVFGIASNSKAFTAAALGILVDEGKVAWDDPVQKHLPAFQLHDPYLTREVTIRDLLSHRTGLGLGAGDLLFWPDTNVTRAEVVSAVRHIRPVSSLRSRYHYNNLAFVVAGEVVHAVTGKSWDDFIRERVFTPLGMKESQISSAAFKAGDNVASPHSRGWRLEGTLAPIPRTLDDTWAAAAGIKSNVQDLSKWVTAQLEPKLWSEKVSKEMWTPQTILPIGDPPGVLKATKPMFAAYGLGWNLRDYKGRKIVTHGGALTGMLTLTLMVPEERLAILVLTNQEEGGAMSSISYHVLDHYFQLPSTDWISAYAASRAEQMKKAKEAERKQEDARARDTRPSLPVASYAGEFQDAWYGKAAIAEHAGKLVLRMSRTPSMIADLEHWHYDTFKAVWRDKTVPDAFVTFALDRKGEIDQMKMEATSTLADFSFDYHDLLFRPIAKK